MQSDKPTGLVGLAAQTAERRAKRDELRSRGINPYPTRYDRTASLVDIHDSHTDLPPDTRTGEIVRVAGRVVSIRGHGRLRFATMEDSDSAIQLMFQADHLSDEVASIEALVDLGDWVGATGELITSRRGELSVDVTGMEILAKALRPLPDQWYGVNEAEIRYRQREVDLLANKDSRRVFDIRFKTLATLPRAPSGPALRGGRDPDPAAPSRRRPGTSLLHTRQCPRHRVQPPDRP